MWLWGCRKASAFLEETPGRRWPAAVLTCLLGPQGGDASVSSLWLVVACSAPKGTWWGSLTPRPLFAESQLQGFSASLGEVFFDH